MYDYLERRGLRLVTWRTKAKQRNRSRRERERREHQEQRRQGDKRQGQHCIQVIMTVMIKIMVMEPLMIKSTWNKRIMLSMEAGMLNQVNLKQFNEGIN